MTKYETAVIPSNCPFLWSGDQYKGTIES